MASDYGLEARKVQRLVQEAIKLEDDHASTCIINVHVSHTYPSNLLEHKQKDHLLSYT